MLVAAVLGASIVGSAPAADRTSLGPPAAPGADLAEPARPPGTCHLATTLCAQNGRFEVTVDFQGTPLGPSLPAHAVPVTGDSGFFWFFAPENVEVMVKVLDGRSVNGAFWVFYGALSNVAYRVTVRDTLTSAARTYDNRWGEMASVADTNAFPAASRADGASRRRADSAWTPIGPFIAVGPGDPYPLPVYALAADPRSPGVVYASHEDGSHVDATLSRSLDGGATWTPLLHTEMGGVILVDPADSNRIEYGTARGVWSSIDGGSSWQGPTGPETYALAAAGGTVYAGAWMRISASRDRESWTELPLPESDDRNPAVTAIGVDPSDPERIFAGTAGGHLWMTADGGASWTLAWSRRDYGPTSIVVDPHDGSTVHVGTTYMGPSPMGLFQDGQYLRSADGGTNWVESSLPSDGRAGGFDALIVDPQSNSLYAGSRGGVYRSADRGITWTRLGLEQRVTGLALSGSSLYAATFEGAFATDVSALPTPCGDLLTLCLDAGRFRVRASWQRSPEGPSFDAFPIALTRDTGAFWFFAPDNVELVVKVLDGRPVNGKFWVFVGGLSSVEYSIEVTDTETGDVWTHGHARGKLESFADTSAF